MYGRGDFVINRITFFVNLENTLMALDGFPQKIMPYNYAIGSRRSKLAARFVSVRMVCNEVRR